jgi:hypothetical protein
MNENIFTRFSYPSGGCEFGIGYVTYMCVVAFEGISHLRTASHRTGSFAVSLIDGTERYEGFAIVSHWTSASFTVVDVVNS